MDLTYGFPSWANAEAHDCLPPKPACWDKNPAMLYLGQENHEKLCRHPYVSPIYASSFDDLPTTLIQSGGCEALHDEIVELVRKLKDSRMSTIVQHEQYEVPLHYETSFLLLLIDFLSRTCHMYSNCSLYLRVKRLLIVLVALLDRYSIA